MSVKIQGQIINVTVKGHKVKEQGEGFDGKTVTIERIARVGRITMEFDGSGVEVTELARLIQDQPVTLLLSDDQAQYRMEGEKP